MKARPKELLLLLVVVSCVCHRCSLLSISLKYQSTAASVIKGGL